MIQRTGNKRVAVVGWGRGMGHKGHMYLASSVITKAQLMGADPYFFISKTVGKDDPLFPEEKVKIYQKVFPQNAKIFQPQGNLNQALTELAEDGYQGVVLVVGADQKEAFKYLEKPNKEGVPIYKSMGLKKLKVISRQETGDSSANLEGPRATPMREILLHPEASEKQKFKVWRDAMPDALGDKEVMDLMHKAEARLMGSVAKKKKIKEFVEKVKPLLSEASPEQKTKIFNMLKEYKDSLEETRIFNPKSLVNVYYVSPNGNRHKLAKSIPYNLVEKLLHALKVKKNIDIHMDDVEVRPADPSQYTVSTSQFDEGSEEALQYATKAHAGQTRSGGDPYISHPVRVANHIKQFKKSHNLDALISAAYLHDTIEDTDTTQEILHDLFGGLVASLVMELTSDPEQIKKMGKAQYLAHKMAAMSSYALVIKLADRLDNVKDITTAKTPEWRHKYATETNHILDYIEKHRALSGTHNKLIGMIRAKLADIDKPQQDVAEGVLDKFIKPKMKFNIETAGEELYVDVTLGEKQVAGFTFDMIGDDLEAQDMSVSPEFRGQGIAQTVYDMLKAKGFRINRSQHQTDDGKHFWDKNKGAGSKVWEQGVAESNDEVWGPQGNFAGDTKVELGNVSIKPINKGDMVKYFGETAQVVELSKDRKVARITFKNRALTQNVKTSDLTKLGQGVAEGKNMPDLEHVGERVVSVMDAERRLAHGDRIFAFHEMDEEPFEIHNVGELAGYDAEQLLAVPQSVAEEADEQKSSNVFQSMGSQLIAMGNDADKIKRHDPSVIEKAIDAKLEKINDPKLTHVTKSFLSKVVKFNRSNPKTMAAIFGFTFSIIARVSMQFSHNMGLSPTQATLLIEALLPTLGNFLGYIVNGFSVKDSVQAGLIAGTIGVGGTLAASGALSEDYLDEK